MNLITLQTVEAESIIPLMASALNNFRRSYRLAVLIEDLPGQIKGLHFIAKAARQLGQKKFARKVLKVRKRKQLIERCKVLSGEIQMTGYNISPLFFDASKP